ncbi:MAG: hypothetical protein SFU86_13270 [Pirellulaceae bacterium]|nr:hypothetical protein [Pirellulaceae bacterium]
MTKLATLRSQLAGLRRARSAVRSATAWSSLATALLWALVGIFVLDLLFELAVPQRVIVILLALAAVVWAGWRFTRPLLGHRETDIDMALLVERQQKLDSDLVAALQFESPEAPRWGSVQLEGAVIDYVSAVGRGINVFEGFSRVQITRRAALLGGTLLTLVVLAAIFPGHAAAFFNRLLLGGRHYPTATVIEQMVVNRWPVLIAAEHGSRPLAAKGAQGRPVTFLVFTRGSLPATGKVSLAGIGSRAKTTLELKPLTLADRLARLKTAHEQIAEAGRNEEVDISSPWRDEMATLLRFDAPDAARLILAVRERGGLSRPAGSLSETIAAWPGDREQSALYSAELGRLIEPVDFKITLGDAWTDPARLAMIPLPIVEPRFTPVPPKYAVRGTEQFDASGRQLSVLEGTTIRLDLEVMNGKPLQSAWLIAKQNEAARRFDLQSADQGGLVWKLPDHDSPLAGIREEVRYEMQVIDQDGLSLETPLRGTIRIRPDRPPTGSAEVVHKVVLPSAEPVVEYRATDDYGIAKLSFIAEIERYDPTRGTGESADLGTGIVAAAQAVPMEIHRYNVLPAGQVASGSRLPLAGKYGLALSPLKLNKGDRVKLTLEVTDYRGENAQGEPVGSSYQSDGLVLEISDESGVLAAISEADERSEQRLTDIIKRQLGIGEAP